MIVIRITMPCPLEALMLIVYSASTRILLRFFPCKLFDILQPFTSIHALVSISKFSAICLVSTS